MKKTISVVIPTRNQADKVGVTIDHIIKTAKQLKDFEVEIIFVNDRSTDNSEEVAKKHLKGYKNSQILNTDKSYVGNGKGLAVELGMTKAKGDYRLFMDADNSTKFEEIKKLIPFFDKYDVVLGTRYSSEVVIPSGNWFKSFWLAIVDVIQVIIYGHALRYTAKKKQGRLREFVSRGANLAFTVLLGQSFTDSRCGFKMYSKVASEKIFPLCRIKTWDFDSEALVLAKKFGYSMVEVPVEWYDDEAASNFKVKDMINGFTSIFYIRWNQLLGRYGRSSSGTALKYFFLGLVILAIVVAGYLFSCRIPNSEIKSYVLGRTNVYILGKTECKYATKTPRTTVDKVAKIPRENNFEIVAAERSTELEERLTELFSSYNMLTARDGEKSFYIYSINCAQCTK